MTSSNLKSDHHTNGSPPDPRLSASIQIVEDEALIASYIQEVLEEIGFTIAGVASSGPEAMSLASERPPDLALVDIKLAGPMDGI